MAIATDNSPLPWAPPGLTTAPAKIGDLTSLVILATSLGIVNPPVQTGNNALDGQLHQCVTTPTVTVGGDASKCCSPA